MQNNTFTIQANYSGGNWEPIDNAEYATFAEAEAGMEDLEQNLEWRNMRIVDETGDVWAYGQESEEEDEVA
ncbi:hypothetical protein [Stenotrophomonas sp.]|uniref:hypothetical protein n=1 Tax=Stenotrophomonas sp. TaxID=69392 RepID=UPI0028B12475|nr:hypothetical protein [Stenotrophomonas sp.]